MPQCSKANDAQISPPTLTKNSEKQPFLYSYFGTRQYLTALRAAVTHMPRKLLVMKYALSGVYAHLAHVSFRAYGALHLRQK